MRFAIITFGTLGDIRPYVALAKAFQIAGHEVFIVTDKSFREFVLGYGVDFKPLNCDIRGLLDAIGARDVIKRGNRPLAFLSEAKKGVLPITKALFSDTFEACNDGVDAILISPLGGISGSHIAEKLKIPAIGVSLQPYTPTGSVMSCLSPFYGRTNIGRAINRLSYELASKASWAMFRESVNEARREVLTLPPKSRKHRIWDGKTPDMPIVYGFSPSIFPKPRDWGEWIYISGYWFLEDEFEPSERIDDFLSESGDVIYVGFGSMQIENPERFIAELAGITSSMGIRAVVTRGWGFDVAGDDGNLLFCDYIPHSWLFPRISAAIHHAGAGTTGAVIRAGIPSIAMPLLLDQFLWADRIYKLGLGPKPIPWRRFTEVKLKSSIEDILTKPGYKLTAAKFKSCISIENGGDNAVRWIADRIATVT